METQRSISSFLNHKKLIYPCKIKYGGKLCSICGKLNSLKRRRCTKCSINFGELISESNMATLILEYTLINS